MGKSKHNESTQTHWVHIFHSFSERRKFKNYTKNLGQQFDNIQDYQTIKRSSIDVNLFFFQKSQANLLAYPWAGRQAGNPTK
jgi:hypothetical protein